MSETTQAAGIPVPVTFKGTVYNVPPRLDFYQLAQIDDNFGSLAAIDLSSLKKQIDVAAVALSMRPSELGQLISPDISVITKEDVEAGAVFLRDVLTACGLLSVPGEETAKNDTAGRSRKKPAADTSESASLG